ncbi:MAG: glycoside hydrolase family 5 protein, partial [Oscillospiraceae bacterium]|nr:glycoside hydrolase family 5 protein [Oscillospiraceae bacterium]
VEYNGNIPVGGSVNFGFNYSCPTKFNPPDTVGFNGTKSSAPSNSQNNNQNNNQNNDQNNNNQNNAPSADVKTLLERTSKAKQGDDWLHTDGNKILDKNGKQVWLTGVNWFGYNTGTNTFDGLWNSNLRTSVKGIADHGFNLIRVPMSAQLLNQWADGEYPRANYNNAMNTELNDMNSLQIFDYFLKLAEENGMKVMPDIHCAETDAMGHNVNLWYTDRVTVEDYYHALEWLAERYKDNDTIIAIDIKNEPHGKPYESNKAIWNDSKDKNNWKYTAETAAKKILAKNPNVLIMVEGTEIYSKNKGDYSSTNSEDYYFNWWGGNLRGVKDYPVDLGKYQNKLVYSPHDYGPTVYEQPWFKGGYDFDSLIKDCWQDNWLYIHKNNTAPLLIGEWGGYMREPNLTWMTCMRRLIKENHLNHTFWCFNANSGDTGGLVLDDFTTWDTEKYNFVKEVLWQENGKFVGLDHAIPLGENGITLTAAKGL